MPSRSKINFIKTSFSTFICLSLLFIQALYAQEYTFEHSDCKIRTKAHSDKELQNLMEIAKDRLEQKRFILQPLIENQRLLPNDLYFELKIDRPKEKLYTACVVSIAVKVAKRNTPQDSDKTLYKKSIKRTVPRITLSGSERCRMALQDAFIHIPICKSIGYSGEKK